MENLKSTSKLKRLTPTLRRFESRASKRKKQSQDQIAVEKMLGSIDRFINSVSAAVSQHIDNVADEIPVILIESQAAFPEPQTSAEPEVQSECNCKYNVPGPATPTSSQLLSIVIDNNNLNDPGQWPACISDDLLTQIIKRGPVTVTADDHCDFP